MARCSCMDQGPAGGAARGRAGAAGGPHAGAKAAADRPGRQPGARPQILPNKNSGCIQIEIQITCLYASHRVADHLPIRPLTDALLQLLMRASQGATYW